MSAKAAGSAGTTQTGFIRCRSSFAKSFWLTVA
eukprot:COSAG03_NODE_27756_length_251_cov_0.828947_1_plen_32_part_10